MLTSIYYSPPFRKSVKKLLRKITSLCVVRYVAVYTAHLASLIFIYLFQLVLISNIIVANIIFDSENYY